MPAGVAGEQAAEHVLEPAVAAAGTAGSEACPAAHGADGVILLALVGIREHRIGLGDVLELLLGSSVPRVGIRVVLAGQLPVSLLDIGVGSVLGNTKDLVKVLVHPILASQWRFLSKVMGRWLSLPKSGFDKLNHRSSTTQVLRQSPVLRGGRVRLT